MKANGNFTTTLGMVIIREFSVSVMHPFLPLLLSLDVVKRLVSSVSSPLPHLQN